MNICVLKNATYEGAGFIARWAQERGHAVETVPLNEGAAPPSLKAFDWLVIMGGPMGVDDVDVAPWLKKEKDLIAEAIEHDRIVLGICLGAQLIAQILGARVERNEHAERGWHLIGRSPHAAASDLAASLPASFTAFLWHQDAFTLPRDAVQLATSVACDNQAFAYGDRVAGLQFHLEVDESSIADVIDKSGYRNIGGPYVQTRDEIFAHIKYVNELPRLMTPLLDALSKRSAEAR